MLNSSNFSEEVKKKVLNLPIKKIKDLIRYSLKLNRIGGKYSSGKLLEASSYYGDLE